MPADIKAVQRLVGARTKEERQAVADILDEFFELEADGWHNKRCDAEIARYRDKQEKARASAEARWSKRNADASQTQCKTDANALRTQCEGNAHQTPDTKHQTKSSASTAEPPQGPPKAAPSPPAKVAPLVIELAVELRKVGVACTASHPRVLEWAGQGVTVQQALEAVQVARMRKPEGEPISANYLAPIIAEMRNPKPTPEPPWWNTPEATIAKGESLGIRAKPGEQMAEYRERIREAVKGQRAAA